MSDFSRINAMLVIAEAVLSRISEEGVEVNSDVEFDVLRAVQRCAIHDFWLSSVDKMDLSGDRTHAAYDPILSVVQVHDVICETVRVCLARQTPFPK